MAVRAKPSLEVRLRVLSAINTGERIRNVAKETFLDKPTGIRYQFSLRTISTWYYRFKKNGLSCLDNKTRSDKNSHRKVQVNELAEAANEALPSKNKVGVDKYGC